MDRLIHDLYKKNIIQIRRTELKNGLTVPFYLNFLKIFDCPVTLELFLSEFHNFIVNSKIDHNCIYGKNDLCKNLGTLISYKYNLNNIIRENLRSYRESDEKYKCILIKENLGNSSKTKKLIKTLDSFNIEVCNTISLINYNTKTSNDSIYFLDTYKILHVLYSLKVFDYSKFLNIFAYLSNNTYLNFKQRLDITPSNTKPIFNSIIKKIIEKKSLLLFSCSVIQKLDFKDLIRTIDFVGKHVSIVKMENFEQYNEIEIKSLIKLAMHHDFKILSNKIYDKLNFIQIIYLHELLNPEFKFDSRLYIVNDNIVDYENVKFNLLQNVKNVDNVLGIITENSLFLQENKFKIYNIQKLEDNILENKLIKECYDLLIVNSTETLVSLKHLSWNLYEKHNCN